MTKIIRNSRNLTSRLKSDKKGSAAIEFAIVGPVFLAMMFSIFEIGWHYYVSSIVDASVTNAARLIRTGQVQEATSDADLQYDLIYDEICDVLQHFGTCSETLTVEVETFSSFADLGADTSAATCADASSTDLDAIPFSPGGELEIVRIRICYIYSTINPAIGLNLSESTRDGQRALVSTMIFRNEPYETA